MRASNACRLHPDLVSKARRTSLRHFWVYWKITITLSKEKKNSSKNLMRKWWRASENRSNRRTSSGKRKSDRRQWKRKPIISGKGKSGLSSRERRWLQSKWLTAASCFRTCLRTKSFLGSTSISSTSIKRMLTPLLRTQVLYSITWMFNILWGTKTSVGEYSQTGIAKRESTSWVRWSRKMRQAINPYCHKGNQIIDTGDKQSAQWKSIMTVAAVHWLTINNKGAPSRQTKQDVSWSRTQSHIWISSIKPKNPQILVSWSKSQARAPLMHHLKVNSWILPQLCPSLIMPIILIISIWSLKRSLPCMRLACLARFIKNLNLTMWVELKGGSPPQKLSIDIWISKKTLWSMKNSPNARKRKLTA